MMELRKALAQLSELCTMKQVIEEAGGAVPPDIAAGLRKIEARREP